MEIQRRKKAPWTGVVTPSCMEEVALGPEGQAFFAGAASAGDNGRQSGQGAKATRTQLGCVRKREPGRLAGSVSGACDS